MIQAQEGLVQALSLFAPQGLGVDIGLREVNNQQFGTVRSLNRLSGIKSIIGVAQFIH